MSQDTPTPDFVVVGHVTRDLLAHGQRPGGSVYYVALAAARLGHKVAVVTSAADLDWSTRLPGIRLYCKPAPETTTFRLDYNERGQRQVRLLARAEPLVAEDIPPAWRAAPITLLAPVARECDLSLLTAFQADALNLALQGWLRQWDGTGLVRPRTWPEAGDVLSRVQAVFLSHEDIASQPDAVHDYAVRCPLVVQTRGADGADVYVQGERTPVPTRPRPAVDPTGAGDVFTAAFLSEWTRGGDPFAAARFGHAAASFVIEGVAAERLPDRAAILDRMRAEA